MNFRTSKVLKLVAFYEHKPAKNILHFIFLRLSSNYSKRNSEGKVYILQNYELLNIHLSSLQLSCFLKLKKMNFLLI